jgi:hypothetical protein
MITYEIEEDYKEIRLLMDGEMVFNPAPKDLKRHILDIKHLHSPFLISLYDQFIYIYVFWTNLKKQKIFWNGHFPDRTSRRNKSSIERQVLCLSSSSWRNNENIYADSRQKQIF